MASAVIFVADNDIPGILSNLASPLREHRRAQQATPFASIGRSAGDLLADQLSEHPSESLHVDFTFDDNR